MKIHLPTTKRPDEDAPGHEHDRVFTEMRQEWMAMSPRASKRLESVDDHYDTRDFDQSFW